MEPTPYLDHFNRALCPCSFLVAIGCQAQLGWTHCVWSVSLWQFGIPYGFPTFPESLPCAYTLVMGSAGRGLG